MKEKYNKQNAYDWTFKRNNYLLFLSGIIFVLFGYILMYTGDVNSYQSITIAPFLLVIGYCILIPVSILYKK
ncbi:MAG: hypothetical protein CMG66_00875 [Candidatus Marinimicrobia bacterium]|nr:hypothetical protein [Candidatus Neomarinimicrobiota bacterium]